jgi:hypothetical protein
MGSNQRPPIKKRVNPKMQGAQIKALRQKKGNLKMQGAENKRSLMKKEATPKCCFSSALI